MLCRNPYMKGRQAFGCGQCRPCRVNKRRTWSARILLEAAQYKDNAFVTLTYDDENLPEGGDVDPRDVQLFLKRLRHLVDVPIRFFAVGEYGDESGRPHYHLALFNFPACRFGSTAERAGRPDASRCCAACGVVSKAWNKGLIQVGNLGTDSSQYLAGYVVKKMTAADDPRLDGKHPEFARMSRRPGLGVNAMHEVASQVMRYELDQDDVPAAVRFGARVMPIGRHLRRKLRTMVGKDEKAPESTQSAVAQEVRDVYDAVEADAARLPGSARRLIVRNRLIDAGSQAVSNMESRARLKRRRSL